MFVPYTVVSRTVKVTATVATVVHAVVVAAAEVVVAVPVGEEGG